MAVDPIKAKASLVDLLNLARARADAFVEAEAQRMKREEAPDVPVGVLRQMIMARYQCVCSAALGIADAEKVS